ncbi:DUF190 domain-containing protein [Nonlabens antarcticus]|uniref:DUF190 domain-containing protein n=1 Tax=Nonlabens antarcticus TaxID=392714 RepID=UPI0018914E51|nr:DUF190 domain-containing protein [Nonlabens antarcticus]
MKNLITIRIYFEYGQKVNGLSFWKKIYSSDFTTELIKRAKVSNLHQVLHLNVNKGYLANQTIHWGTSEIKHFKHPHLIEITDSELKINKFIDEQKDLLQNTQILIVKNEIIIREV